MVSSSEPFFIVGRLIGLATNALIWENNLIGKG